MRHHVRLRERTAAQVERRLAERLEEAEVDVDGAVGRAVEGPGGRRGGTAGRVRAALEQPGRSRLVLEPGGGKLLVPVALHAVDHAHDPAVLTAVGVGTGAALRHGLAPARHRRGRAGLVEDVGRRTGAVPPACGHQAQDDHHDQADESAADGLAAARDLHPAAATAGAAEDAPEHVAETAGETPGQTPAATGGLAAHVLDLARVELSVVVEVHGSPVRPVAAPACERGNSRGRRPPVGMVSRPSLRPADRHQRRPLRPHRRAHSGRPGPPRGP